jgi:hypothetical protein
MQFQVPQFIDVEDKIIGPLTLKQFIYLAIAAGFCFILFFVLQTWLWIIVTGIIGVISAAFAFLRFNGRPLSVAFIAALGYIWRPKFYIWKREAEAQILPRLTVPKAEPQPLKHLWLKMNTSTEAIENREKSSAFFSMFKKPAESKDNFEVIKKETGDRQAAARVDYR